MTDDQRWHRWAYRRQLEVNPRGDDLLEMYSRMTVPQIVERTGLKLCTVKRRIERAKKCA